MKKHILFSLILLMALPGMAQEASVRKRHGGGHQQPQSTTLTVVAPRHVTFWLYVDDVLQNEQPVRSICIRNMWEDSFYVRVELNNEMQSCVGQFVDLRRTRAVSITQMNHFFGLEYSQANIRPELTMDLITETWTPEPPYGQNGQNGQVMPPPMPPQPVSPCMNEADFNEFRDMLAENAFDSGKLTIAKQAISSNPMCVHQIAAICRMFSFENNKLEFAKYAYAYCTEKNKYYLINDVFSYESSKNELNEYIIGQ